MSHSGAVNEVIFDSIWHRAKKEEKSTAKDIYLVYSWCHACSSSSWVHSWIYVCINTREEKKLPHSRTTLRFLHLMLIGTLIKFVFITWLKCYSIYIKNILFVSRFCFQRGVTVILFAFKMKLKKGIFNQHYTVLRWYVRFFFPWGLAFCNATWYCMTRG